MQVKALGSAVALDTAAAQTAVENMTTPFMRGRKVRLDVTIAGLTGTPTAKVQQSDDNSTWTDEASYTSTSPTVNIAEMTLKRYTRLNVTVAGSAGTITAVMTADN